MRRARCCILCVLAAGALLAGCRGAGREKTTLVAEAAAPPEAAVTAELPEKETLAGNWYGWWRIDHTSGDWAHMYGYWWDCAAWVTGTAPGEYSLTLRDEDMLEGKTTAWLSLAEKDGALVCTEGRLLDRDLPDESLEILLSADNFGPLLTLRGRYTAVMSKGAFSYEFFLRPWGSRWPEQEDAMPFRYRDWYLPLVEAGEDMPPELWNANGKDSDS